MHDTTPRGMTGTCPTRPQLYWITMFLLAMLMRAPAVHAADKAEFTRRIELVCIGNTEAQVLQLLERQPDRTQRSNVLGVHKSVLEFDVGAAQYTLSFYAGHLVAKTIIEFRDPKRWL